MAYAEASLPSLPSELLARICDMLSPGSLTHARATSVSKLKTRLITDWSSLAGLSHPLCPLSETCRRIRAVCVFKMFRTLTIPEYQATPPPPAILPYVQSMQLRVPDFKRKLGWDPATLLSQLSNLKEFYWVPDIPAVLSDHNLRIINHLPTLASFTLGDFKVEDPLCTTTFTSHLRELDLSHWRRSIFEVTRVEAKIENAFLESLIAPVAHQLEVLRLPAESCRLSFLASNSWPQLRELTLRGGTPRLDAPFPQVLLAMPNLRILAAAFVRFAAMPLVLVPSDPTSADLPSLTRLTLIDPEPDEEIVTRMSSSLTELCLREMPRHYVRRLNTDRFSARILTCSVALPIVQSLSAGNLRRLELVVREDHAESELLAMLARTCVGLEFLELHRYAQDEKAAMYMTKSQLNVPTVDLATALTPLKHLRVLRLNLDIGVHVDRWREMPSQVYRYWHPVLAEQATLVARVLPWLDSIAFLTSQTLCSVGWSTWELNAGGTMRYVPPLECLDCDCTWL